MAEPNFRALAQVLVDALADHCGSNEYAWNLIDRARAALATPPPEPPTDREIREWLDPRRFAGEKSTVIIRAALERWG